MSVAFYVKRLMSLRVVFYASICLVNTLIISSLGGKSVQNPLFKMGNIQTRLQIISAVLSGRYFLAVTALKDYKTVPNITREDQNGM